MGLVQELNVNGIVVCDCGNRQFLIGSEEDAVGVNFIRLLECSKCGKEMPVPFKSFSAHPPGPTVESGNVIGRGQ